MVAKKILAIPVGVDPKGWSDIRSAWSRHQVANQGGYEMETLRDFLVPTLADLDAHPGRLSTQGYARFFNTMAPLVPWRKFGTYRQDVRMPIMVAMGLIAERSGDEKSLDSKGIPVKWLSEMKKAFDAMLFSSSKDSSISEDMLLFLNSDLSNNSKLRICKNFTFPEVWFQPEIIEKLKPLLPTKESEAFKFFPWDPMNPSANKLMVNSYFPSAFALLDLSLDEEAWKTQATIAKSLLQITGNRKKKDMPEAIELPSDLFGEP